MNILHFIAVPKWVLLQNYKEISEKPHTTVTILTKSIDCLSSIMYMLLKNVNISLNRTMIQRYYTLSLVFHLQMI